MVRGKIPGSSELISPAVPRVPWALQSLLFCWIHHGQLLLEQVTTWSDPGCPMRVKTRPQSLHAYKQQCIFIFIFKKGTLLYTLGNGLPHFLLTTLHIPWYCILRHHLLNWPLCPKRSPYVNCYTQCSNKNLDIFTSRNSHCGFCLDFSQ